MKIFKNLEIKKCLHGKTKNNEEGNAVIWKHCPKDFYVGLTVLEIGTASVEINVNDSVAGMLRVLATLGIIPGSSFIDYCNKRDKARIFQTNRKQMELVKH